MEFSKNVFKSQKWGPNEQEHCYYMKQQKFTPSLLVRVRTLRRSCVWIRKEVLRRLPIYWCFDVSKSQNVMNVCCFLVFYLVVLCHFNSRIEQESCFSVTGFVGWDSDDGFFIHILCLPCLQAACWITSCSSVSSLNILFSVWCFLFC